MHGHCPVLLSSSLCSSPIHSAIYVWLCPVVSCCGGVSQSRPLGSVSIGCCSDKTGMLWNSKTQEQMGWNPLSSDKAVPLALMKESLTIHCWKEQFVHCAWLAVSQWKAFWPFLEHSHLVLSLPLSPCWNLLRTEAKRTGIISSDWSEWKRLGLHWFLTSIYCLWS